MNGAGGPDAAPRQALVLLADGCEEIEAVTILDVLHRGGVGVFGAAVGSRETVVCAHGTRIKPQFAFAPGDDRFGERRRWGYHYDAIVLPGGMGGTLALRDNPDVLAELREANGRGAIVAAVCAGPMVLDAAGLLAGRRFCCYPGIEKNLSGAGTFVPGVPTVTDGNLVTGTGPGTAMAFALAVLRALGGSADAVAEGLLAP